MSLTTTSNGTHPIARVVSPDYPPYFIYIDEHDAEEAPRRVPVTILDEKLDGVTLRNLNLQLAKGLTIRTLYNRLIKETKPVATYNRIYNLDADEKIEVLPADHPENVYGAGPNGSGKSYVIGENMRNYQRMFPNRAVILFARQPDDPAFEGVEREEIVVDKTHLEALGKTYEDFAEELAQIPITNYSNSLVVFDDCDNLQNPKLSKAIHALVGDLMANGRKLNISVYYIGHLTLNNHKTKIILNESNRVYLFPQTSGLRHAIRFFKEYAGLDNKQIQQIINVKNSRWVMLSRKAPRYIATEKSIYLL